MPWNRYETRWKRKERSCLSGRRRNYRNDCLGCQGQAVVPWNIEMQDKTSEHQESSRESRFGIRSITFGKGNLKEVQYFGKQILRKLSKITEKVRKLR